MNSGTRVRGKGTNEGVVDSGNFFLFILFPLSSFHLDACLANAVVSSPLRQLRSCALHENGRAD